MIIRADRGLLLRPAFLPLASATAAAASLTHGEYRPQHLQGHHSTGGAEGEGDRGYLQGQDLGGLAELVPSKKQWRGQNLRKRRRKRASVTAGEGGVGSLSAATATGQAVSEAGTLFPRREGAVEDGGEEDDRNSDGDSHQRELFCEVAKVHVCYVEPCRIIPCCVYHITKCMRCVCLSVFLCTCMSIWLAGLAV